MSTVSLRAAREVHNKVVDAWAKCTDKVADAHDGARSPSRSAAEKRPAHGEVNLGLHDGPPGSGRARGFEEPDEAACRLCAA